MLRCFIQENLEVSDEYLQQLAFAYNTAIRSTTGVSSFQILLGRLPRLPVNLIITTDISCQFELEPEENVREKELAMKKVFASMATVREDNREVSARSEFARQEVQLTLT